MIAYFLQLSGYTLLFYAAYLLLLKKQPYAQLSRLFLGCTIVLPFVLPLMKFSWPQAVAGMAPATLMHYLPEVTFQSGGETNAFNWTALAMLIYTGIAVLLFFKNARQWWRFRQLLKYAEKVMVAGSEIALLPELGPGSFGTCIFFPNKEIDPSILRHEQAHVAQRHDVDLLVLRFLRVVCWPHFLLYFLEKELRLAHEFAADRAAVGRHSESYAHLLLAQTFGISHPHPFIHTFFHHPLKQRIMMLQQETKTKTGRKLGMKAGLSLLLLCGLIVFAQCSSKQDTELGHSETTFSAIATPVENPNAETMNQKTQAQQTLDSYNRGVRENRIPSSETNIIPQQAVPDSQIIFKYVEQMPEFNGDVSAWLETNMRYPESAQKEQKSGRVVTKFVVSSTGDVQDAEIVKSSGVPALDEEAIRVIRTMPRWKPGVQSGKPVAVYFYLPIQFALGK